MLQNRVDDSPAAGEAERARRARGTECMSRLASGVAHELASLLMAVCAEAEMAEEEAGEGSAAREHLEAIRGAATQAMGVTRHLLLACRPQPLQPSEIDLGAEIAAAAGLLRWVAGEGLAVELALGAALPRVTADPLHLNQFLFLVAGHAGTKLPEGGRLAVQTSRLPEGVGLAAVVEGPRLRPSLFGAAAGFRLERAEQIARDHGGALRITSQRQRVTLQLALPIAER